MSARHKSNMTRDAQLHFAVWNVFYMARVEPDCLFLTIHRLLHNDSSSNLLINMCQGKFLFIRHVESKPQKKLS